MNTLITTDLHFTDRDADYYRWKVFEQVKHLGTTHKIPELFILGDLCENKDFHSSRLVNRIVEELYRLHDDGPFDAIHILRGNHDGLDPDSPYFLFLRRMPWVTFHAKPVAQSFGKDRVLFLPHSRNPEKEWGDRKWWDKLDYIFMHGTVKGSVSETGFKMDGVPVELFKGTQAKILSGDVHVPQKVGPVEYVGAPYPIRFGDTFDPRVVALLPGGKQVSFPLDNIRKHTLILDSEPSARVEKALEKGVQEGDHVKFVIKLADSEMGDWQERKKWAVEFCQSRGAELHKVQLERIVPIASTKKPKLKVVQRTPAQALAHYCKANAVAEELATVGVKILEE